MTITELSDRWIAERAIALVNKYGEPLPIKGHSGFAQQAQVGEFYFIYTTPFSGLEVYPGKTMYMVDIWLKTKVFSCVYDSLEELNSNRARKRAWLAQYRLLQYQPDQHRSTS